MLNKRQQGKIAEEIIANHYAHTGYRILWKNFTIPGGELDIVAENTKAIVFIEVKAVDHTDNLHEYVSERKIATLKRTIQHFLYKHPTCKAIRLDVAFVKNNIILDVYENVTNN